MNGNWKTTPREHIHKRKRTDAETQYFTNFTILQIVKFWYFSLFRSAYLLSRVV